MKKSEESLCALWETIKIINIKIIWVPGEEGEKGPESLFKEIVVENFPNLDKELDIQLHKANRLPYYFNLKLSAPRHIKI